MWVEIFCLREQGFQKLINNTGLANTLSSGFGHGQASAGSAPSDTKWSIPRLFSLLVEDGDHYPTDQEEIGL